MVIDSRTNWNGLFINELHPVIQSFLKILNLSNLTALKIENNDKIYLCVTIIIRIIIKYNCLHDERDRLESFKFSLIPVAVLHY
jgi:hypothetical protein